MKIIGEQLINKLAIKTVKKMTKVILSITEDLKSLTTAFNINTDTHILIPEKAFLTTSKFEKLLINAAIIQIINNEGTIKPNVATMAPEIFSRL